MAARDMIAGAAAYVKDIPDYLREVAQLSIANGISSVAVEEGLDHLAFLAGLVAACNTLTWLMREYPVGMAIHTLKSHVGIVAEDFSNFNALIVRDVDPVKFAHMREQAELRHELEQNARKDTN